MIERLRETKLISGYPEMDDWIEYRDKLNEVIDYLNNERLKKAVGK